MPHHEPRLLVDRVLSADRRLRGRLDRVHVNAHGDLVAHGLEVVFEGLLYAEGS
jgi:hypothetical protein